MKPQHYYLKFYADTSTDVNRLFTFKVNSEADARAGLKRFQKKGVRVRAAYFVFISPSGLLQSHRIGLS